VLRCPLCRGPLEDEAGKLRCTQCGESYPIEDGIPRLVHDSVPGFRAKRRESQGWVTLAREQGWYEPDDDVDAHLPFLRELGWDDPVWDANAYSFRLLLDRYVERGQRVLEVGAAKCWAANQLVPRGVEYVGTDTLTDPNIGLGRGAFYVERVGPFQRVQADGERLPFADGAFDVVFCVAALHHALDLRAMVGEMARVARRGGVVAALNEGTRALGGSPDDPDQDEEKRHGINEHVHTLPAYVWAFVQAGLAVRRVEHAEGDDDLRGRRIGGKLRRLPVGGRSAATWFAQMCYGYSGVSLFARKIV
jgi:SAM-dependent methyltransferase/uncharacterized protein YbaR (Trm112 family)